MPTVTTVRDWRDVRRGAVRGLRWGAIVGGGAAAAWCALDGACRDEGDGGGAILESAMWGVVSGAAIGALVGALVGAMVG